LHVDGTRDTHEVVFCGTCMHMAVMVRGSVREVEVPCVLNMAAVRLRLGEYEEAIHECNKVGKATTRVCSKE
jgi:hypothetical protein